MSEPATTTDFAALRALAAHCRKCRHRIGEYVEGGRALKLGAVRVRQRLTFYCDDCGARGTFRPGPGKILDKQ